MGGRKAEDGGDICIADYVQLIYVQLIHAAAWQKQTQHCKAITLQLKKRYFFM